MEETFKTELGKTVVLSDVLTPEETIVYSRWLHLMNRSAVDYVVGGGFALFAYTGIWRSTKDIEAPMDPAVSAAAGRPWGADWAADPTPLVNRKGGAL